MPLAAQGAAFFQGDNVIKRNFFKAAAGLALAALVPLAQAQDKWPSRPIKIIVSVSPGGTGDMLAREYGRRLGERLGQPVVVENRPGGNGIPATLFVKSAPADGYTLFLTLTQHIQNPVQFPDVGYDPVNDFTPLARLGAAATVVVARAGLGVNSAKDLQAHAGKGLSVGTSSLGAQVVMEVFSKSAKLGLLMVPYKGEQPALQDLLGGQVDLAMITAVVAKPHIQAGKLKPIAMIAPGRASIMPDVPTFQEQGFTDVKYTGGWYGFIAPAKLPPEITATLIKELRAIRDEPGIRKTMDDLNIFLNWAEGAQFGAAMKRDMEEWQSLVKRSGVTITR
jgi:tripartite-type tricarboxylate transporter receptor subunit TctC